MAKIKIQLIKSAIGYSQDQKDTVKALGLGKMHSIAEHEDNACIQGMINKVSHLIRVLDAKEAKP
jgi:large subunit ribosomal protein L30